MRTRIERLWPLLALAGIALVAVLAFPYLASAYYLEAGGRVLDDARRAEQLLNKALAWDSNNAQAYRMLARVHRSDADWLAAEEALGHYIKLKPENPLGYLELAGLYEELETLKNTAEKLALAQRVTEAWQGTGYTAARAIDRASAAQAAGRDEEALVWLWRAIALQSEVGDGWHELGLWYQKRQMWSQAAYAFERALDSGGFDRISPGDPAYYVGLLYQSRLDPPDLRRAIKFYDQALTVHQFSTEAILADCHYQRGEILRLEGNSVEEYIAAYELAVAAYPQHVWAHARLGYAYYQRDRDVTAAEAELKTALSLAPSDKWLYIVLGDIYLRDGHKEQARVEYHQALEIDPSFSGALARLKAMEEEQ
jgi:tetratricopeptide (TPR) repeat protein